MMLTLYKLDVSPPARSVLMVIHAANIPDVKYVDVNIFEGDHLKEEYLKKPIGAQSVTNSVPMIGYRDDEFHMYSIFLQMNPQHTIPTLKDDDFTIWDSHAISVYLLTKYSNNKSLYPTDPKTRAIIDQRLHFDSGILFSSLRGAVEPIVFRGENSIRPEALEKIKTAYAFSEQFLTKPWMAGDDVTLADICCVSSISSLNEIVPIDAELYPNLDAWLKRCEEQDFYKKGNKPGSTKFGTLLRNKLG